MPVSLHTDDPGPVGAAPTHECAWVGYSRQEPCIVGGVAGNGINKIETLTTFPPITDWQGTITHYALIADGVIAEKGVLVPPIRVHQKYGQMTAEVRLSHDV